MTFVAAGAARAEDLVSRAVSVEAAQISALAGRSVEIHSRGTFRAGKTPHAIETMRRIEFRDPPALIYVRGSFDGKEVNEAELREKITGKKTRKLAVDLLILLLQPLSRATVTLAGTAPDGSATLRAVPRDGGGKVRSVMVRVDAQGRKLDATPELGGDEFKYADKKEFVMQFSDDGAPREFRSYTHGKFLWFERSLEMAGNRVMMRP